MVLFLNSSVALGHLGLRLKRSDLGLDLTFYTIHGLMPLHECVIVMFVLLFKFQQILRAVHMMS